MKKFFFDQSSLPQLKAPNEKFDARFIHADNFTVAFNKLLAGAEVPAHKHLHETIDYVQEGILEMTVDGETILLGAGMVARVPSNISHSAKAITDCKVINVFYPVREDFG